ncbi:MAG: hypothetical protein KR126chlam1_00439 [Chlamydiae bacterium]|nr:hypothetical protein [Chlamydiota bacterium]
MKLLVYLLLLSPLYSQTGQDDLQFGKLWPQIRRYQEKGTLEKMIAARRAEIIAKKNHWKAKLSTAEDPNLTHLLKEGTLTPADNGKGGAYILSDKQNTPLYVIKSFDEEALCLNNRKHFASPFNDRAFRIHEEIPLYRSVQAEALCASIAMLLHLNHLTPPTHLAILEHEAFFDITDRSKKLTTRLGPPTREKLCSVQPYLPNTEILTNLVDEWTEETFLSNIDLEDFENLMILIWLFYDTDAHAENIHAQKDEQGIYHLIKIDNGLTFPNQNTRLLNALAYLPNAIAPLSQKGIKRIQKLPLKKITERIAFFEMDDALAAFEERVHQLQTLAKKEDITLREIDDHLQLLQRPKKKNSATPALITFSH